MKKSKLNERLDTMHLSDIYSLMLFILYKLQDIPEYATTSELCYLLDGGNMTRLLTYFAGQTITFPTEKEMEVVSKALLVYQYVNMENKSLTEALKLVGKPNNKEITNLYIKILDIMRDYNIDRGNIKREQAD